MRIASLVLLGIGIARYIFAIAINLYHSADIFTAFGGFWSMVSFAGLIIAFIYILKTKGAMK